MKTLSQEDLAAIEAVESTRRKYRIKEDKISQMPNLPLTPSEQTGEKPKLEKLRHHKDIAKLEALCKMTY